MSSAKPEEDDITTLMTALKELNNTKFQKVMLK